MRSFEKLALFAVVSLFVSIVPAFASGGGDCEELNCSTFFSPWIIQSPMESPLFLSHRRFLMTDVETAQLQTINMKEWAQYFHNAIPENLL
ncbi:MAG TPA: hypothetical protein VFO86_16450, partial [Terriglobia bacterium]|nr:hypothetical protein [Terriglobia bacterium]